MTPLYLFITLLISMSLPLQLNSQHFSEQTILMILKEHWGNPSSLASWTSTPSSPCDWPEVQCTSGSITRLHLSKKGINATLPSSICQLKNLVWIDLSQNKISGHIPVGLSNCSSLESLNLSMNELTGTIPGKLFLMQKLRELSLRGNKLFGEIPTLITAFSLTYLDLSNNQLNGSIPGGLFCIVQLNSLSLGYNNLSGQLPAKTGFSNLQFLNLTHNNLNGKIPQYFGLKALDLSDNRLYGDIVEALFHVKSMSTLRLCSNKLKGKIPYDFVKQEFSESCLDHSNLCSETKKKGLTSCPSSLCSNDRFEGFLKCDDKYERPRWFLIIFVVLVVGCVFVLFTILYYLARKRWLNKETSIAAIFKNFWSRHPSSKDEEEWEMISFQKLNFNKKDILSGLRDENIIGTGGSGKVYRVLINQASETIAVKSILNAKKSDHRLEKEFLAEIRTVGTIRHYNIVKLLCYISSKDSKLLVYQYFKNKSLDQWLHRRTPSDINSSITKLDWPMRMNIAIGAAQGLCYIHHDCSPPIVHRDIKSSNILLDSEFNAKIADFGLSKLLNMHGCTESASVVAGTFGYIAPDVYSFGVVLLELTTGREAVTRGDHMNLAERAKLYYKDTSEFLYVLDDEIKDPIYMDQIITVFRLGVICTATLPSNRPSMKDCLHILQKCSNSSSSSSSSPNVQ